MISFVNHGGEDGQWHHKVVQGKNVFDQCAMSPDREEHKIIVGITEELGSAYLKKYDPLGMTPKTKRIEAIRVKRYEKNDGCFPLHIDARTTDNCSRYLAFLYYLNDTDAGTKFHLYNEEFTIPCVAGNVLVFPPLWMFPHEGLTPTDEPKYIMSVYFHFMNEDYKYGYQK